MGADSESPMAYRNLFLGNHVPHEKFCTASGGSAVRVDKHADVVSDLFDLAGKYPGSYTYV